MDEPEIIEIAIRETTEEYPMPWRKFCQDEARHDARIIFDLRILGLDKSADKIKAKLGDKLRAWQEKIWPTLIPNLDQKMDESLEQCIERSYKAAGFVTLEKE